MSDVDRLVPFYEGRAESLERDAEEVRDARERIDYLLGGMGVWAADLRSLAARHDEQLTRAEEAEADRDAAEGERMDAQMEVRRLKRDLARLLPVYEAAVAYRRGHARRGTLRHNLFSAVDAAVEEAREAEEGK